MKTAKTLQFDSHSAGTIAFSVFLLLFFFEKFLIMIHFFRYRARFTRFVWLLGKHKL